MSLLRDQVRKLQERSEFIEDSKIFQDPDSPSSSGSAHVPHQALITSSSRKPSGESRMQRNAREEMSIPGSIFDCQPARRVPEELHNDSKKLEISLAILRKEELRKVGVKNHCNQYLYLASAENCLESMCDSPCRGYRDLCSKWHERSESSFFGDASGEIP